jgi:hypothetical protein
MNNLEIAYNADNSWPEANVTSNECYGCCGIYARVFGGVNNSQ